ncbi:MAG: High-affinity branched-chain amino acid transport system permease protein LivH [Candidatus Omnitrophica bacterium]|nr:High-affinity branched-chain amino acid transport system permease protein LivH [Candidatus Omnitrophota bacterium]
MSDAQVAAALLAQQLINGLTIGLVYALIALGYTMVYGVIQLINFAHGEVFMLGAYLALTAVWLLTAWLGAPPAILLLCGMFALSVVGCALTGRLIERVAYRPLRGSPKLTALITSIGVSFFLQNAVMLLYGSREQSVPEVLPMVSWEVGGVSVSGMQLLILAVSAAMMVGLDRFVRRTRTGKAMRACAENTEAASLMGISPDAVIRNTFMLGSGLAAVGGMLFAMNYGSVSFHDGYLAGLKAFTAAVFGGIGSIPGAMIGGILLGVFEGLAAGYLSSEWKDVFAFGLLVCVLIFRPSGILGENLPEKV